MRKERIIIMSNTTNTTATTKKPYELKAQHNREILHTFFAKLEIVTRLHS